MRKIICCLLTLCLLLLTTASLVSCEAFDTPQTMVTRATAKTAMQDSYEGTVFMDLSFELFGQDMQINISSDLKATGLHSENSTVEMKTTVDALGKRVQTTSYQKDGWSYVVTPNASYKTKIDEDSGANATAASILKEIPKDLFEGTEIVKAEDGTRSVTVTLPSEVFAQLYDELVDEMMGTLGADIEFTVSDAVVSISVKDGLISLYDIRFTMTVQSLGMNLDMDAKASIAFTKYGGVTVQMPTNYENFKEQK